MSLRLVKLDAKYKKHLNDMMEEWYATGEKIIPYAIRRLLNAARADMKWKVQTLFMI